MQISVSKLRAYSSCPQKFFYRYIATAEAEFTSANLQFGNAMHHALSEYHQSLNTMGSNGMFEEFLKYWKAIVADCEQTQKCLRYGKDKEQDLIDKAINLCVEYVGQFKDVIPNSPDDVEVLFEVPLYDPLGGFGSLEHTLIGKIDLVANGCVYEFKTASQTPSQGEADASIQLTAYAMAYHYLYDEVPEHLYLTALVKTQTPKIVTLQTARWYKEFQNVVDMGIQIARAIEAEIFYRNRETEWGCHNCEYEQTCLGFQPQKERFK